jgi:hypothetical protein
MHYTSLSALTADRRRTGASGPVALILIEDGIEIDSTLAHHAKAGFAELIVFCAPTVALPKVDKTRLSRVDFDVTAVGALPRIINAMNDAMPGQWLYYCYNAEYLFYPYCEHRTVGEMLTFMTEERRNSVMTYVIDLYARDLSAHPTAVALDDACFDTSGYYALARQDAQGAAAERQVNVHGGLRWRFEEHIPMNRRRLDRVSFFRAMPGLKMLEDGTFSQTEYNTYACPWHHNLTAAVASFRTAKALRRNPGSRHLINTFDWPHSVPFTWASHQLLDMGMMEPGQWF